MALKAYKTLIQRADDSFIVNKSRFIGYGCPCETEEEALAFLAEIRAKHKDATHNCYCFVRGGDGSINAGVIGQAYMNGGNTTDWKVETISFRTGDSDKLCIDFRVVAGTYIYIDDVELYEMQ